MMDHATLEKVLPWSYDETLREVVEALKAEGFGVLTEVDVRETLRAKLDVDFPRYKILGACNPPLAYRALQLDRAVGTMMPCNVVVYDDGGRTVVRAIDPTASIGGHAPALQAVAEEVRDKLELVLARLG